MIFIYWAPFILVSASAFVVCLVVPRLRRFMLYALVAPLAFGVSSLGGAAIVGIAAEVVRQRYNVMIFSAPLTGVKGAFELTLIYILPGVLGALVAVIVTKRVTALVREIAGTKTAW